MEASSYLILWNELPKPKCINNSSSIHQLGEVIFEKETMIVVYDDKLVNDNMIISALKENNYSCSLKEKPKKDSPIISFFKNLFN